MPEEVALIAPPPFYTQLKRQQKQIRNYLLQLASAEGPSRCIFWQEQIAGAFLGKPTRGEELQLLEQHFDFQGDPDRTKVITGFWAMKLLTERNLPENTDEIVQIIYQALHHGGRLIPNSYFDRVIISDYNVSEITQTLTKITLLRYLTLNHEAIARFIAQNQALVEQHYPLLLRLNTAWLSEQAAQFTDLIAHPYDHVRYAGAPWSRIPAPIPTATPVHPSPVSHEMQRVAPPHESTLTPWQQLWKAYRNESPKGNFNFLLSFYRTNKFFCSFKKRTKEPVKNAPFWTRLFYRIIFWLNVPLVLDTIYYQFWLLTLQTLKVSIDYVLGLPQQPLTSLIPAKKWCALFLTILFAPFILLIPLVLGVISVPFNCIYLFVQKCLHRFFEQYHDISKFIRYFLTAFESWIKFNLFVHYLGQWSQFLGRIITLPSQWVAFAGPGSLVIGIGVSIAYFLHQLWEKNFEFQSLIDNTFGTLIHTVMNDPLTHLVSVTALIVTPATFAGLVITRLVIGVLTGNAFRTAETEISHIAENPLRAPHVHERSQAQNIGIQNPIIYSNRSRQETRNQPTATSTNIQSQHSRQRIR